MKFKKMLVLLLATVLIFSLCACGGNKASSACDCDDTGFGGYGFTGYM